MIDRAQDTMRAAPVVDHSGRVSSVGRLIVAASALVAVVVALVIVQRATSGPFLLGLLLILAAIGVIALLGGAIGLFGLAGRAQGQTMVRAFVDAAPEGVFSFLELFHVAEASGRLQALRHGGAWYHVGTPEAFEETNRILEAALKEKKLVS